MSYPTHDNVAPQQTGGMNSPAPQYTSQSYPDNNNLSTNNAGIAPVQQTTEHQYNEKSHVPSSDPQSIGTQNDMPTQQPTPSYQQQDHFQHDKAQQQQQNGTPNQYANVTPIGSLQQSPAPVDCPICGVREMTRTEFVSGGTTHISAILLCCCLCLGCIPYLASWFKDCEHHCGNCGKVLAVWHRSGHTEVLAHQRA